MPVPNPLTPVDIGRPVALVNVADVGVPNIGVTNVGLVENTKEPVPVSSETADAKFALDGVAKNVAMPVPKPDIPEDTGSPVQLVKVPDAGVPNNGVTNVGDVANTLAPVPVSSVSAAAKFAEVGVARNVATLEPKPEMPVDTGRPVQLVNVPEAGVPNTGVTRVGLVANTKDPEPVSSVTVDAKLAEVGVPRNVATPVPKPDIPVETGNPVPLASVIVGPVPKTNEPVPVSSVTAAARFALDGVARNVATLAPKPDMPEETGKPVQLVNVPDVGVPNNGVTSVGEVFNTLLPEPVDVVTPVPPCATANAVPKVKLPGIFTTPLVLMLNLSAAPSTSVM